MKTRIFLTYYGWGKFTVTFAFYMYLQLVFSEVWKKIYITKQIYNCILLYNYTYKYNGRIF